MACCFFLGSSTGGATQAGSQRADTLDTASCGSEVGQVILAASLIKEGFCFKKSKQTQRDRSWVSRVLVC